MLLGEIAWGAGAVCGAAGTICGAPPYGFAPYGLYATAEGSVGTAGAIDSEKESSALVLLEAAGATGANAGGCVGAGSAFELKTSSLLVGLGVPKSS